MLQTNKQHTRGPMKPVHTFLINAFAFLLILWLLFGVICGIAVAPNGDMGPSIKLGDMLLYYRFSNNYKAQDVVIINKNNTEYVGRIIAVAGDTVEITDDGILKINNNNVNEPYTYSSTPKYDEYTTYPVVLNDGEYFILVDNRNNTEDSRYYGPVNQKEIKGTVITVLRRNNI